MKIKKETVLRIADRYGTKRKFYTVKKVIRRKSGEELYELDDLLWDDMSDKRLSSYSKVVRDAIVLPPVGSIVQGLHKITRYEKDKIWLANGNHYRLDHKLRIVQEP